MVHSKRYLALFLLILLSLLVVSCATPPSSPNHVEAARVESIEGTDFNRLLLSEKAVERLDLQTATVLQESVNGTQRTLIPYSALIYDVNGQTWVYTRPEPLTFIREAVSVDYIENDLAVLAEGPPAGVEVVTVGVAELYGVDTGVGQ